MVVCGHGSVRNTSDLSGSDELRKAGLSCVQGPLQRRYGRVSVSSVEALMVGLQDTTERIKSKRIPVKWSTTASTMSSASSSH